MLSVGMSRNFSLAFLLLAGDRNLHLAGYWSRWKTVAFAKCLCPLLRRRKEERRFMELPVRELEKC